MIPREPMNRYVVTKLDEPSFTVRVHAGVALDYATVFTVTECDDGSRIYVSGLKGQSLGQGEYRAFAAEHFPQARLVTYERLTARGMRKRTVEI